MIRSRGASAPMDAPSPTRPRERSSRTARSNLTAPHAGLHAIRVTIPPAAPSDEGVVSSDATGRAFASFDLPEPVMAGIRNAGFTHCTPIQE